MDTFTYECLPSQSVFYQVLNAVSDGGVKIFNVEIIFHFKSIGTEKHMWTSGVYR